VCDGLAFVCVHPFPSHLHPQLRYLHGSGSGISPACLQDNVYLIHLVLSQCQLNDTALIHMDNANLRFLDLSENLIEALNTSVFLQLPNLHTLLMADNPLTTIHSREPSEGYVQHLSLQLLDLSNTTLSTFSSKPWEAFPLRTLNLSFTQSLQKNYN
jgi:Leucine-rich repeat (LRR) protein